MNKYLITGFLFLVLSFLFVGVFADDEFNEASIFLKYKPSLKMYFKSPIGMQDLNISDLSPENQVEERYFQDFIIKNKMENGYNLFIPFIIIQLTLTFLCFGSKEKKYKIWKIFIHFLINSVITTMGIAFILTFAKTFTTIIIGIILILINYSTFLLLQRDWKTTTK